MLPVAAITVIMVGYYLVRFPHWLGLWLFVVSLAAVVAVFKIRLYALRVQDRVIRLEERPAFDALLQEPLRTRIGELTDAQFVGLRLPQTRNCRRWCNACSTKSSAPPTSKRQSWSGDRIIPGFKVQRFDGGF